MLQYSKLKPIIGSHLQSRTFFSFPCHELDPGADLVRHEELLPAPSALQEAPTDDEHDAPAAPHRPHDIVDDGRAHHEVTLRHAEPQLRL